MSAADPQPRGATGNPRDVACPTCNAPVGADCRNMSQPAVKSSVIHAARAYLANERATVAVSELGDTPDPRQPMSYLEFAAMLGNLPSDFATRRRDRGLTLRQLAKEIDVPLPTVHRIERGIGNPTFGNLCKIAKWMARGD